MCGIAGLINPLGVPLSEFPNLTTADPVELCKAMLGLLVHRGPDEMGFVQYPSGFLASARLSIVDISHGTQPLSNEDSSLWITYNGEVYDTSEHILTLKKAGYQFKTRSDTEVVLHLFEQHGLNFVDHLNGEFAFCIYNSKTKSHFLVRDPFGTKPLYFREIGHGALLFASEIKPLLWASNTVPSLSPTAIAQTLQSWVALPPTTAFKEIRQLAPGSILEIDSHGKQKTHRFSYHSGTTSKPSTDGLKTILEKAVRRRLQADVPVGVYLSGGLDSSILASLASEMATDPVSSFSVAFTDSRFDESAQQEVIAKRFKTRHHSIRVDSNLLHESFHDAVLSAESLVFRSAFVPMFLLSKLVQSAGIKVVLSGEGADEMLGGYDIFKELLILKQWSRDPASDKYISKIATLYPYLPQFQKENLRYLAPFYRNHISPQNYWGHKIRWSHFSALSRMLVPELANSQLETELTSLIGAFDVADSELQCKATEAATLLHGYLLSTQGDRMANAHSIELRLPFLDRDLVNFSSPLSLEELLPNLKEKALLRESFVDRLPAEIVSRVKTPYLAPDSEIFLLSEKSFWKDYINEQTISRTEAFLPGPTLKFVADLEKSAQRGEVISRSKHTFFFTLFSALILQEDFKKTLTPKPVDHLLRRKEWIK